ncbi:MAG: efflux RND transporter periplasmic adaptor subunit [Nitrospirae bacterium]|nr:efflux RND transporter periplasmic adaptor subunit [Nitrospirota bacterium]
MKKIIAVVAVVAVLAAAGFFWRNSKGNGVKFRTEKVTKGDIVQSITASGTVNAVTTVLVGTQVSGTIKDIFVDFNSVVKKGQLIAQIDPAIFDAQVAQARANVLSAKANVEKAVVALADAKRTFNRQKELFAKNLISRSDVDTAETAHDTAGTQVSAAKAQLSQTEAALRIAETNLRYSRIESPVNGTVVSRNVDPGQTVAASFQTPTLFTIAQDLTKMQVDSSVAEADIGKIQVGQPVEFSVDAYPDSPFQGTVSAIRNAPITVQNVVTYDVVVKVENPELKLKPGMTANVSIIVSSKKDVLRVSNTALRFRPPSDKKDAPAKKGKGIGVWVLENEKLKRIAITTGINDGTYTELLSGEIAEGQEIIVESLAKPKSQSQSQSSAPRMRF